MSSFGDGPATSYTSRYPGSEEPGPGSHESADEDVSEGQEIELADIDMDKLVDKVYALLKQEVRVERERLGRNRFS